MTNSSKGPGGGFGEIRANIDIGKLNAYLAQSVSAIKTPVEVKQFKFGQSNPTYFLTDSAGKRFVLRKKPAGKLISPTAHQIEREYRILNALHKHNTNPSTTPERKVPVPEAISLCEDVNVIGTAFYIMEYLEGRIFTSTRMPGVPLQTRRECWLDAVRALAVLGSLDPIALGLSGFGPTTDYYPRQIKSLGRVSAAQATVTDLDTNEPIGEIPYFNDMISWYKKHLPDEKKMGSRIVHGDYKLDNLIFHPAENRVIGILDWELCTLGNPLADLAGLTQPWSISPKNLPKDDKLLQFSLMIGFKGVPIEVSAITREELEQHYAKLAGLSYPIPDMVFVRSWMLFRLSVISQGIAARRARKQASSEMAHISGQVFPIVGNLARIALEDEGIKIGNSSKL